jgi:hypothetical protein
MAVSRNEAHWLAKSAADLGAYVLRGTLAVDADGVKLGEIPLQDWLAQLAGAELVLIAAPIGKAISIKDDELRSCHTCGRDYQGSSCPYCAEARARLRG